MDRADVLRMVLHRHHRIPVHPKLSHHASRRSSLDSARPEAVLEPSKIRSLRLGLAGSPRYCPWLRVRFEVGECKVFAQIYYYYRLI